MNRCLSTAIVAVSLVSLSAWAATTQEVSYSGNTGGGSRNVVDSQGNPIPFGNDVEIGFFNGLSQPQVQAEATGGIGSLQNLWSSWDQFGSTQFRSFFPDNTTGEFAADNTKTDAAFNGQTIFMWIFQTSDNLAPVTTGPNAFSTVLEWGLYTSSASTWVFPATTAQFNIPQNITTADITTAFFGGFSPTSLQLASVPEPTGLALLGLGLAFVLGRRLRR